MQRAVIFLGLPNNTTHRIKKSIKRLVGLHFPVFYCEQKAQTALKITETGADPKSNGSD